MASPFLATPAQTPIAPTSNARYYYRRQIHSRVPITASNWSGGKTAQFNFEASGGHMLVPNESRLVMRIKVTDSTNGKLHKSVRFATDPVTNAFNAALLSVNGTTVSSTASDLKDISLLQLRTEGTKSGEQAGGSAGLLSFNQKMTHEETPAKVRNFLCAEGNGGTGTESDDNSAFAIGLGMFSTKDERNDKHQLLLNNASALFTPEGHLRSGNSGVTGANMPKITPDFAGAAEIDLTAVAGNLAITKQVASAPIEISTPLGQMVPFLRQGRTYLPDMQFNLALTINPDYASDMFFSERLDSTTSFFALPVAAASITSSAAAARMCTHVPEVAAVVAAPKVQIEEIYIDAMFAVPAVAVPPPSSLQVPFQEITAYHRVLGNNSQFTENFTSSPPSVGAIFVALRDNKHDINVNSETFKLGGDSTYGFSRFSMQLGSLILAQPAYELNMSDRSVARAYADYLSAVGAGPSSDRGQSMTEWCSTLGPILAFRVLQEPGSYASTLTLRFNLKNALIDAAAATPYKGSPELVVYCVHQKVFEAFWEQGQNMPSRVLVDDVLN